MSLTTLTPATGVLRVLVWLYFSVAVLLGASSTSSLASSSTSLSLEFVVCPTVILSVPGLPSRRSSSGDVETGNSSPSCLVGHALPSGCSCCTIPNTGPTSGTRVLRSAHPSELKKFGWCSSCSTPRVPETTGPSDCGVPSVSVLGSSVSVLGSTVSVLGSTVSELG